MKHGECRYLALLLSAIVVVALVVVITQSRLMAIDAPASPPPSGPQATYIGSTACMACHPQIAQGWAATAHGKVLADPQLPEGIGGCEACHGPGSLHVGSTGKEKLKKPSELTASEVTALCGKCHFLAQAGAPPTAPAVDPDMWKMSAHARGKTTCLSCHQLHGDGEHSLSAPPAKLCLSCHSNLISAAGTGRAHAPVKDGQCLLCHDPHGTASPHSLKPAVSAECEKCHDISTGKLVAAHQGYTVSGSDCTRCHDPHSFAADRAYLRAVSHPPFAQGNCQICHTDAPSNALKKPVPDACLSCHPKDRIAADRDANGDVIHVHASVAAGLCTRCHEPHVSDTPAGLHGDAKDVCASCHRKIGAIAATSTHSHPPAAKGECLSCHKGHGSVQTALLIKDQSVLCQDCHKTQAMHAHPTGPNVKDPSTGQPVTCASCHAIHGSEFSYILPQQETAMCLSCHQMSKHES